MIVVQPSKADTRGLEEALIFASQLAAAGFEIAMSRDLFAGSHPASIKYASVPFARDLSDTEIGAMLIIGAEAAGEDATLALRRYNFSDDAAVIVFGRFANRQEEIGARTRYTYVTNQPPHIVNLEDTKDLAGGKTACPAYGIEVTAKKIRDDDLLPVSILSADLEMPAALSALQAMQSSRQIKPIIAVSGKSKTVWLDRAGTGHPIYQYSEIAPAVFSQFAQIVVATSDPKKISWANCVVNNAIVSGDIVIDATPDQALVNAGLGVIQGPSQLEQLNAYLADIVIPNLPALHQEAAGIAANTLLSLPRYMKSLGFEPPARTKKTKATKSSVWFMPTNGIGLGHAQRCCLVADELGEPSASKFAAYSSCLPMIRQYGYDAMPLIPTSLLHEDRFANDLVNYYRLRNGMAKGDTLVFDGGYIYDSVMHAVLSGDLNAIWIRRGLWTPGQNNRVPLDREKIFRRVISPQEALESLNAPLSNGSHVFEVGPIVQRFDDPDLKAKVRKNLQSHFGQTFKTLSVTMLGGGVAADLSAHLQAACSEFERRSDHLNLIVNWPGAVINPALYGWENSHVVSSRNAGLLAFASDFIVSAVGYNSFHEALYNKVPAIFVPQTASFMDDQAARAEAAAELGLARHVAADRPGDLVREIAGFFDRDRISQLSASLADAELPEPGNVRAAELISEVSG